MNMHIAMQEKEAKKDNLEFITRNITLEIFY